MKCSSCGKEDCLYVTRWPERFGVKETVMQDCELKITKDKVVAAAKTCTDADKVLRTLFPEAFPPPVPEFVTMDVDPATNKLRFKVGESPMVIEKRSSYSNLVGMYLGEDYAGFKIAWTVEKDKHNVNVLVGRLSKKS